MTCVGETISAVMTLADKSIGAVMTCVGETVSAVMTQSVEL